MKHFISRFIFLFFLVPFASAQYKTADTLLLINNTPVLADEFEKAFNKNRNINIPEKQTLPEYFERFLNFKLKVCAALDAKLDTLPSFKNEFKGYRDQLAQTYLTDKECQDSLIREAWEHTQYDVNVSHIMVLFPDPQDTLAAYKKIHEAWNKLKSGESFEKVAATYSEDPSVKVNSGILGYFTAFRFPYQFERCSYQTPKGEISAPLRTNYGYHIIRVLDRRPSEGEVKVAHIMVMVPQNAPDSAWSSARNKILGYYGRIQKGEDFAAIARQNSDDRNSAQKGGELSWFGTGQMVPEFENVAFSLHPGEISKPVKTAYGWHLIKLLDKRSVPDFNTAKNDLKSRILKDERADIIKRSFTKKLKNKYHVTENSDSIGNLLIKTEDSRLESDYADFRDLVQEYHDGILLFDIMNREVWSKSADSSALQNFYQNIRNKPKWDKRLDATVFSCSSKEIAEKIRSAFEKNKKLNALELQKTVCDTSNTCFSMEHKLISRGESTSFDSIPWKKGFTGFFQKDNQILFAYIWKVRKPETKTLDDIKGLVSADYQNYLEEIWIQSLKNKYRVVVNQDLLNKIAEKYK